MRAGPLTLLVPAATIALAAALIRTTPPGPAPLPPAHPAALVPAAAGDVDAALARDLFGTAPAAASAEADVPPPADTDAAEAPPADAETPPAVIGIAGRLGRDALVLVRRAGGGTRTLAIGEAAGGWRLESIAADAVLFARGGRRVRVDLPAG